jgi:hypothetical protein
MIETVSIAPSSAQSPNARRTLLYVAWAIVLALTVPEIILRAFMQLDIPGNSLSDPTFAKLE